MAPKHFKLWRWAFYRKSPWYFLMRLSSLQLPMVWCYHFHFHMSLESKYLRGISFVLVSFGSAIVCRLTWQMEGVQWETSVVVPGSLNRRGRRTYPWFHCAPTKAESEARFWLVRFSLSSDIHSSEQPTEEKAEALGMSTDAKNYDSID